MQKKYLFAPVAILLLLSAPASQADGVAASTEAQCTGFRLDDAGGSFEHQPPLSQTGTGFCYGFASTALYDAWRFSHGGAADTRRSSPVAAVIEANLREQKIREKFANGTSVSFEDLDGGDIKATVEGLIEKGGCARDPLAPMSDLLTADRAWTRIAPLVAEHQAYLATQQTWSEYGSSSLAYRSSGYLAGGGAMASCFADLSASILTELGWPSGSIPDARTMVVIWNSSDPSAQLRDLLYKDCSRDALRVASPAPRAEDHSFLVGGLPTRAGKPSILDTFRSVWDQTANRQPIGISYCSKVLRSQGDYQRPEKIGGEMANYDCGRHASALIGRQWRDGQCQYLLQNTNGESCDGHDYTVTCEPASGRLWLTEKQVLNSVYGTTHMREQNWSELALPFN